MAAPSRAAIHAMARDLAAATGIETGVFDFAAREFDAPASNFCAASCPLAADGSCDPQLAHRFGCYEAERWDGQYIYYCPASLVFTTNLVWQGSLPEFGLVSGPVVLGPIADLLGDFSPEFHELIAAVPGRSPAGVNALGHIQARLCGTESAPAPLKLVPADDLTAVPAAHPYPIEVEHRLVRMIRRGDRAGAAELINQLLGALYLSAGGDLPRLRRDAAELVAVFSRAAIEGGADADSIFGQKRALDRRLAGFATFDEVSAFLVSVFNRFVGYVFDFSKFQHANTIRKTIAYVRANYARRVTLTEAAKEVWMSPSHLSTVFSAEMGMGFSEYVREFRIEKAKELLLGNTPIAEVAAATGFSDQSYFTKVFTKQAGVSPAQFRRQAGGGRR